MNLVKAQEYAASLPLAELKKYADGLNPSMIPPWLATGEMEAKTKRMEMANNLAAAAQGQKPSIKEQVEKKAGLMALQQAQMAQQQGAAAAPQPGGPVPEGTPEPEQQPQQQAGLDQLPSNIQMAGGGIVAFSGTKGSKVEGEDEEDLPMWALLQRRAKRKAAADLEAERDRNMAIARAEGQNLRPTMENDPRMLRAPVDETVSNAPPAAPKPPINDIAQLAAAQNKPRPQAPAAPAPAPAASAAPAAPAAPAPESMEAMLRDSFKNKPPERKIDDLVAEQKAIDKALGLDVPAGKDKLERIAALKDQYQATQKSPLQELIAMLGQAGQYKGLSGMAPAYTSMAEKKREADLKHAKDINELMGGVEDTQRSEKTATKTKVGTAREKDIETARAFDREKMQTLGTARGQDVQASSSKYNADMHYKAAMAQMSNANARQDAQEKRLLLDSFKTRIASIDKELAPLLKTPYGPAKDQIAQLQAEKAGLTKALDETSGIAKIAGAPSAASPSGTTTTGWGKASVVK